MSEDKHDNQNKPPDVKKEILKALNAGARFRDAARAQGKTTQEVRRMMLDDSEFGRNVRNAKAKCKVDQLIRLSEAKGWQAPVFLLERKWPAEFGRRKPADAPEPRPPVDRVPLRIDISFLSTADQQKVFQAIRDATPIEDESCPMKQLPDLSNSNSSMAATNSD